MNTEHLISGSHLHDQHLKPIMSPVNTHDCGLGHAIVTVSCTLIQDVKDVPCVWRVKMPLAELYGLPTELPDRLVGPCRP